jgi:hypothetical protein
MTVYKKLKVNLACPRHKDMKGNVSIAPPIPDLSSKWSLTVYFSPPVTLLQATEDI